MRVVFWENSFRRALKRLLRKSPQLQQKVTEVLVLLESDPFTPSIKTHKLQGDLKELWSCSVEYDCRIIFAFEPLENSEEELIVLIDIGSHDDVY